MQENDRRRRLLVQKIEKTANRSLRTHQFEADTDAEKVTELQGFRMASDTIAEKITELGCGNPSSCIPPMVSAKSK